MIRLKNKSEKLGVERNYELGIECVQGGVLIEGDEYNEKGDHISITCQLSPLEAMVFTDNLRKSEGRTCWPLGPEKAAVSVDPVQENADGWSCVNIPMEVVVSVGDIHIRTSTCVTNAMRIAVEAMMTSLFFPTNG